MISVENLSKSYGDHVLFDNISFQVNARERIGLVGRNGHGKTTLFRIISGLEHPDSGAVLIPKQYRISYVRQHIRFTRPTVLEEGMRHLPEDQRDHHWKVERILSGLGFTGSDMKRNPHEFSGGYQVRLNLAKILVSDPDMLLLDEPTNYLDIASIRWIEQFLSNWPHELMLITHDRSFMDKVVTHTIGIHRQKARKISGDTGKYYAQIALDEEVTEKTRINDEKRRREIELFITRFRAKARLANMVQSRIKTLAKMTPAEQLEKIRQLDFSFHYKPFSGKQMLRVEDLGFGYDRTAELIQELGFTVESGERICVIGKNGKGKTTLLKLLAGSLAPGKGAVSYNPSVAMGFFEQTNIASLVATRTVEEEILYSHPDTDRQLARNICGAMLFEGDDALKKIEVLSGGEKSRVMLGKLLVTPLNLLILDEPTNHLDMDSCDALLAALDSFPGTVIMVTHNEMFLHALATRLIVFQDDQITVFDGDYQRFLDKVGWSDENLSASATGSTDTPSPRPSRKEMRKLRSEIITRRSKALKPLELQIEKVESDIIRHESLIAEAADEMTEATRICDGRRIADISLRLSAAEAAVERLFTELDTLTQEYDTKKSAFDTELNDLEASDDADGPRIIPGLYPATGADFSDSG